MKRLPALLSMALVLSLVLCLFSGCGLVPGAAPPSPVPEIEFTLLPDATAAPALPPAEEAALPETPSPVEDAPAPAESIAPEEEAPALAEDGVYTSKEDVALYLHLYGRLPSNFITKKEARDLGWEGGSLEPYAPGMCIGGDHFGNYEGLLPKAKGRSWQECDINTLGKRSRGPERLAWSNDGLIYYTGDHYETWELLYGEP